MLRRLAAAGGENTKSFLPSGFNGLVAMPWVLSKGSIAWNGAVSIGFSNGIAYDFGLLSASAIDGISYEQFANALGAREGDQVTLIAFKKRSDIDESSCLEPVVSRIILAPPAPLGMDAECFTSDGKIEHANPLNENTNAFTFKYQTGHLFCDIQGGTVGEVEFVGGAIICSRRAADGSWLRSAATMVVNTKEQQGGYTLRQASMVVANDITTPSDWYLNNANESSGE